jgi:hypothetical protein
MAQIPSSIVEYCAGRQVPLQKEIKLNNKSRVDWSGAEPGSVRQEGATNLLKNGTASSKTSIFLSAVMLVTAYRKTATLQMLFSVYISVANCMELVGSRTGE